MLKVSKAPSGPSQGLPGNDGAPGAQGIQGPIGPQGLPGNDGAPGAPGANGTNGLNGSDGIDAARYVVDASGFGTHTTINAAIAAAVSDGFGPSNPTTVIVRSGNYAENVSLVGGIHLQSSTAGKSFSAQISGNVTFTTGGVVSVQAIDIAPASGNAITFGGSGFQQLYISNSVAYAQGSASSLTMSNTGAGSGVIIDNMNFRVVSGGSGTPVSISAGTLQGSNGTFWPTSPATPALALTGGAAFLQTADVFGQVDLSGNAGFSIANSQIRSGNQPGVIDATSTDILIADTGFNTIVAGPVTTNNGVGNIYYTQLTYTVPGQSMPAGAILLPGSGPTGPAGPAGPQGPQGPQGNVGPAGNDGAPGAQGIQGPIGPQGLPGNDGAPGAQGPQGLPGNDGAPGAQGPQGLPGNDGAPGAQGPQGLPGNDGAPGAQGIQGPPGIQGPLGPSGPMGAQGAQGPQGPAGVVNATAPLAYNGGTQTVSLQANGINAGLIANRVRTQTITGSQFTGLTSTSAFNWSSGNRGVAPRSFGSNNSDGQIFVAFQVPDDYAGPSSADLLAVPGIQAPRFRIKWVTDSVQVNGDRKANIDISWAQDFDLSGGNATRFRYNIRRNATGTNAAESADPTNVAVATQVVPEAGDNWSVGEGPVVPWAAGQTIFLTLARNASSSDDPNGNRVGIISVTFEYESDQ